MGEELNQKKKNSCFCMISHKITDIYSEYIGVYALGIYLIIIRFYNPEYGYSFPSHDFIAQKLKISSKTVLRHIEQLYKYRLITKSNKIRTQNGTWLHNTYHINDPSEWIKPYDHKSVGVKEIILSPDDSADKNHLTGSHTKKINNKKIIIHNDCINENQKGEMLQARTNLSKLKTINWGRDT